MFKSRSNSGVNQSTHSKVELDDLKSPTLFTPMNDLGLVKPVNSFGQGIVVRITNVSK